MGDGAHICHIYIIELTDLVPVNLILVLRLEKGNCVCVWVIITSMKT
jgi:hypothetical protein